MSSKFDSPKYVSKQDKKVFFSLTVTLHCATNQFLFFLLKIHRQVPNVLASPKMASLLLINWIENALSNLELERLETVKLPI